MGPDGRVVGQGREQLVYTLPSPSFKSKLIVFEDDLILFPQSTSMKVREEGRDVKAANKLLREVDWEETLEREEEVEKNKVEVKESLMQIVTDLNYLARELARAGNEDTRNILLKVDILLILK